MLLALPLPAVPAVVELGLLELGLLELLDAVDEPEAGRALVSMNSLPEPAVLEAAPAVPVVPVVPVALPPPCRQPVTVMVLLALGV